MEDDRKSTDQYGRRTWDVDAYAKSGKKKPEKDEGATPAQKIALDSSSSHMHHRDKLITSLIHAISKHTLINASQKNKRFGFLCPLCNLSYRDNMALIDHFNSPQHIQKATSQSVIEHDDEEQPLENGIRHATLQEVQSTLKLLLDNYNQSTKTKHNIQLRIQARQELEQKISQKKRNKRKKPNPAPPVNEISKVMGFSSFGKQH